jgi:hypothetical protein
MARLIASGIPEFCGHSFFVLSWRMPRKPTIRTYRVWLRTGEISLIPADESDKFRWANVFHLFDGHRYSGDDDGPPCLSIISP